MRRKEQRTVLFFIEYNQMQHVMMDSILDLREGGRNSEIWMDTVDLIIILHHC